MYYNNNIKYTTVYQNIPDMILRFLYNWDIAIKGIKILTYIYNSYIYHSCMHGDSIDIGGSVYTVFCLQIKGHYFYVCVTNKKHYS